MKRTILIFAAVAVAFSATAQKVERGPYTLETISDGIYQIQDYNSIRGRGMYKNEQGQTLNNNCSDMYLVVGKNKALLIDLSNNVQWADNAAESLRSLVNEYARGRELVITVTHSHGDHVGMLPAYADDEKVGFWIPKADFAVPGHFPEGRTTLFEENVSIDLGGITLKTLKVEGHTPGSTLFFVDGRNIVFTGDAIGSGNGVWIFSTEAFAQYKQGVARLISFLNDPSNGIQKENLIIYGGHSWQGMAQWPLGAQYIFDMQDLIGRIEEKTGFETIPNTTNPRLDTHYKYGKATITWNRASEKEYIERMSEDKK